jgi:outer membrane lipoprotein-sorting protein
MKASSRICIERTCSAVAHPARVQAVLVFLLVVSAVIFSGRGWAQAAKSPASEPDAATILEKAEHIRFPADGFETFITINTTNQGQPTDTRKFRVLSKGTSKTVALLTDPVSDRGQILLMNGRDFWVYLPNVSQPVRLPLSQKLSGEVANGDIARANFLGDYNPQFAWTENIDGEDYYVLELSAVDKSVTYHRILYWIKKSNFYPYKAEFYSMSGGLIKTCSYERFQPLAGKTRPTRLVLTDALRKGEQSVLEYSNMVVKDIPDRTFSKDYLKRID